MAAARAPRKSRRTKASRRSHQLARAAHKSGTEDAEDDTMMKARSSLTAVCTDFDTARISLIHLQTDPPNKAKEVFAIPELLETILIRLPRKDALMCQRVNQTWRGTTAGSVKLQRFLFLAAEKDPEVVALVQPSKTPLLSKYVLREDSEAHASQTYCQAVVPNPLIFFNTDIHNRGNSLDLPYASYADLLAHSQLPYHNTRLLAEFFNGLLSYSACLEMFLTQPPVKKVEIEMNILKCCECGGRDSCCFFLSDVTNPKGLRVKDIFAALRSYYYKQRAALDEVVEEDITSISIAFPTIAHGSRKGVILLDTEDMRSAKVEALKSSLRASAVEDTAAKKE